VGLVFLEALLVGGCTAGNVPASSQPLIVAAPASLRAEFDAIVGAFKARHPDAAANVITATPAQIAQENLPVDVVAAEGPAALQALGPRVAPGDRRDFASNPLCLVVRANAAEVHFASLPASPWAHKVAIADGRSDPTGAASEAALGRLGLRRPLDAHLVYTANLADSLERLARGDVDVALARATDVAAWGAKAGAAPLKIADRYEDDPQARLPIVILSGSPHLSAARALVDEVLHGEGQTLLARKGLLAPPMPRLE
jgi:molybdate transport system substrate-binding protein